MSFKTSKISYLSFTFKLNEKKVPLKKYGLETGGYKKTFYWRAVAKCMRGCWKCSKKGRA